MIILNELRLEVTPICLLSQVKAEFNHDDLLTWSELNRIFQLKYQIFPTGGITNVR
ncbi:MULTISPECIES: hypothetical protein [Arthrospira]|uniref:Transposase n=1 Tax=Limnospira platensis NIES-46 TaxID=1236695 RepID=A0A5M3TGI5_LIMPL|nr:hypothetical protein [Arthrospira platensis]MBD2710907.1 hypothetical protein [Arthrospira platensis FACHB-835]MDF2210899.1 hypothetical protein [Arthrospira platensis NCB002]MDT9183400.1 hypothetical protein [Limnospira sp. PMC 289.06]MDT9295373.1 hypothetical protein [Arthrospira platensis PCC 7345]MDT9311195.1 hypothetical protein [Limnospira sp. Paracas R14]QQW30748.1 hypothetical protein AP9108_08835 [Arthrospira sp. PCC 9108]BAI89695.1 hypothetical protein NIES39_D02750 [Arthrospira